MILTRRQREILTIMAERRKVLGSWAWLLTRFGCLLIGWGLLLSWWLR